MIVYGGWDGTKTLNDMYELSLNTFLWYHINYKSELTPPQVYRHACITIGDSILIFGGINELNEKFNELYLINFQEKKWSLLLPSGKYPCPRTYHNMIYFDNKIFVIGGFSKNSILNDFYCLPFSECEKRIKINNMLPNEIINIDNKINKKYISSFTGQETNEDLKEQINFLEKQIEELKNNYENEITKNNCKVLIIINQY